MEENKFLKEDIILNDNFQSNIDELKNMSFFLNTFINNIKNSNYFQINKTKSKRANNSNIYESILLDKIEGIYDAFKISINNIKNIMNKVQKELIEPINLFINEQTKIYQISDKDIKELVKKYKEHKIMLEYAKNKYYKSSFELKKNNKKSILSQYSFKNEEFDSTLAQDIKNKMIAKNYENIYKYEIKRYNSFISDIKKDYNEIKKKIESIEEKRILFIKENLDKFKLILDEISNEFLNFMKTVENNSTSDIIKEEQNIWNNKLFQFQKDEEFIPLESFISFKDFYSKNQDILLNNKYNFDIKIENIENYKKITNMKEKEMVDCFNSIITLFLDKETINQEKINLIFDIFQNPRKKDPWKIFIDCLLNKNTELSILKFVNLKNLEDLGNCLNYAILREDSIFEGNFEINLKIIYISEKTFYMNEENNDKIYLSAILSKNKYLRTSQYWRNILEFKLANKINEAIKRFNDVFEFKNEKKKGFFSKIGGAIGLSNSLNDSIISKSRIMRLIKNYNDLDKKRIEIIDKISIQELLNLIKDNIPNMMNFNHPPELCLDLIAKLIDEYKISKKNIKYYVIYTNVCSNSIRRFLKTEENSEKNKISNFKNKDGKIKIFKILAKTIPYLNLNDYNKILLCSKTANKSLKNKIYSHVLKQKNISNKIRLIIWENKLKVKDLKNKYNYKEILSRETNVKAKKLIEMDVTRTSVKSSENEKETKNNLINVLCAITQINNEINYYQGMQYIVLFLMELYGEEEAFFLFLALLLNTEYPLLFEKNLQKLKIFFYVFKRIISLFEPELNSFLNINNLPVDLFLSPWFVTLFCGAHHYLRQIEDNTPIIIRIIDFFILYGWKSSMSLGCALLHTYEQEIVKLNVDCLNKFLLNDILKQDFFLNKNINLIENCMKEFKISKKLISNIEAEYYSQEKK